MDKKHNIRNMSVIAHVDHVSAPTERRARVSGVDCAGVSIALSEPPSTGFGLAGGRKRRARRGVRVEDACRRPGRLGRVAGGAGDEADASRPSSRPPRPRRAHTPRLELPLVHRRFVAVGRGIAVRKMRFDAFFLTRSTTKKKQTLTSRSSSAFPLFPSPSYATTTG